MDVNARTVPGQAPCRTRMIEVDVGDEDMPDVFESVALGFHGGPKVAVEGFRSCFHEDRPFGSADQESAHGAFHVEVEIQQ